MRHRKRTLKLGRTSGHRRALLGMLVCSLIERRRIRTTVVKAKAARRLAEKMVTLGKAGTLSARRRALAILRREPMVGMLFGTIAPQYKDRAGGYCRILRLGRRHSDGSEMAFLEWVGLAPVARPKKTVEAKDAEKSKSADAGPEGATGQGH